MSDRIEVIQSVDIDEHVTYRARGIVRYNLADLAAALGVEESRFVLRVDPVLWAAEQKKQRRHRPGQAQRFKTAEEAFWSDYHGHE